MATEKLPVAQENKSIIDGICRIQLTNVDLVITGGKAGKLHDEVPINRSAKHCVGFTGAHSITGYSAEAQKVPMHIGGAAINHRKT